MASSMASSSASLDSDDLYSLSSSCSSAGDLVLVACEEYHFQAQNCCPCDDILFGTQLHSRHR